MESFKDQYRYQNFDEADDALNESNNNNNQQNKTNDAAADDGGGGGGGDGVIEGLLAFMTLKQ